MKKILVLVVIMSLVLTSLAMAASDEQSASASVTVNEFIDITITDTGTAGFSFGSQNPGTSNNKEVDQVDGVASVTPAVNVKNEATSNVDAKIRLKGDDFISGANTIAVTNVDYDDDGAVDEGGPETGLAQTTLTTTYPGAAYATLISGSSEDVWYWMDIPTNQAAGSYTSTFYFEGNSV